MKLNRKWLLLVALVLSVAMATGGTLAYLTDTDDDVNVMTLGNVKIEQLENGEPDNGFNQGQPLYPAYYVADTLDWSADITGAVDKEVTVKNTGTSEAYVRTWLAFEAGSLSVEQFTALIHIQRTENDAKISWSDPSIETIEGVNYYVVCATYQEPLAAGETSVPSLLKVAMDKNGNNEDVAQFDGDYVILAFSQGVQTKNLETLGADGALNEAFGVEHPWQGEDGEDIIPELPVVHVNSSEELNEAIAAVKDNQIILLAPGEYEMARATIKANNVSILGSDDVVITEPVKNEYIWRFQGDNITLSNLTFDTVYNTGNWTNTITVEGDNFVMKDCTMDGRGTNDQLLVISGSAGDVTISNCNFVGAYRQIGNSYGSEGSTILIENCTFGGNTSYAVHFDTPKANVIVRNCEIKGHSAIGQNGNGNVSFENCKFLAGDTYNQIAIHRSLSFIDCHFSQSFALGMSKPGKTLTFVGGTWEGWDSVKARVLDDSFSNDMTAVFDGDTWSYVNKSWSDVTD